LIHRLTHSVPAAFLGGLAFAFAPYRVSHLAHIQVLVVFWAPLALLGLHAFIETGKKRWLALYGVCWALQGAAHGYYLVYFSVLVGLWVLWFVVAQGRWRTLAMITATTVAAALPLAPILLRFVRAHDYHGFARGFNEIASFGADIAAPLCAANHLTFWGWLRVACGPEGELFPGAALLVMCVIGLATSRLDIQEAVPPISRPRLLHVLRRVILAAGVAFVLIAVLVAVTGPFQLQISSLRVSSSSPMKPFSAATALFLISALLSPSCWRAAHARSIQTFYAGAALICWALSWGPIAKLSGVQVLYQPPFVWLMELPGIAGLRTPARFWMMAVMGLVVVMSVSLARLLATQSRRAAAALSALATFALLADGWTTIPVAAAPERPPAPERLRGETVLTLPLGDIIVDANAVFSAVTGGWRAVNGYSGFAPAYYEAIRVESVEENSALFRVFRTAGDLHVIVRDDAWTFRQIVEAQPSAELVALSGGRRQYRLPQRGDPVAGARASGMKLTPRAMNASCSSALAENVLDADLTTRWSCGPQREGQELAVDFGGIVTVGAVVNALGKFTGDFPRRLLVETSRDGTAWERAWTGSMAGAAMSAAVEKPRVVPATAAFTPRQARFMRLRQLSRDEVFDWSIAELEVWSDSESFIIHSLRIP
jgi:hypothetical protein